MALFDRFLKKVGLRSDDDDEEDGDADEGKATRADRIRLPGPAYRTPGRQADPSPETSSVPFVVSFRSTDGTDFTLQLVAELEAPSDWQLGGPVRQRIAGALAKRLADEGSLAAAVELLAVMTDFVRVACLGSRVLPAGIRDALSGTTLKDVRTVAVIVDSHQGKRTTFRFS